MTDNNYTPLFGVSGVIPSGFDSMQSDEPKSFEEEAVQAYASASNISAASPSITSNSYSNVGWKSKVPPTSAASVANYKPYTDTYRYNTLLHKPYNDTNYHYNTSGYFKISDNAYIPLWTQPIARDCNGRISQKFTTD